MKQLFRIAIIFTVIMLFFLGLFVIFNNENGYKERDIIEYNEKLHLVEEELAGDKSEQSVEKRYNCKIIYSKDIENEELSALYKTDALVLDLVVNDEYVGKVAWDDNKQAYDAIKRGFFGSSVFLWVIVLISGYLLLFLMYYSFIKPVRELKKFSVEIAKGNLDDPLPIKKDNLFGSFVEAFDVMREELKNSKKREIQYEIARKEMVTDLSHDIKTPVSVIKAACEVLEAKTLMKMSESERRSVSENDISEQKYEEEKKDTDYTLQKITTISQKADLISSLVTNLMHSTLDDIDKLEVKPVETDSQVLTGFFENLKNYGNIIIENEVPRCLVYMDSIRMEQVIDNIIGNSHKYAGTDVRVNFSETAYLSSDGVKEEDYIRITIKDSGPGVKEDDLPLITQKYYRGKNSSEQSGYGLGLYLVKRYMELQYGGMEYYNDKGFTVELLLKKI
ncbi:MAG: HAMP domain-containing histidine kinase [Lachnospiraceae bacterium]|nr:HAMP domain-containing histidine kinase [Lachnospiraceae bacterium]